MASMYPADDSLTGCHNTMNWYKARTQDKDLSNVVNGIPARINDGLGALSPITITSPADIGNLGSIDIVSTPGYTAHGDAFPILRTVTDQTSFVAAVESNPTGILSEITLLWRQGMAFPLHMTIQNNCHKIILDHTKADYEAQIERMQEDRETSEETLRRALHSVSVNSPNNATANSSALPVKFEHPDPFDGKKTELDDFIIQVSQKMSQNPIYFTTAAVRVAYTLSRLKGKALATCRHAYDASGNLRKTADGDLLTFQSPDAVFKLLRVSFGDPDEKRTAEKFVMESKQGNKKFSDYIVDFLSNSRKTGWSDDTLISHLESALNITLKQRVIHHTPLGRRPNTLHEYVELIRTVDADTRSLGLYNTTPNPAPIVPAVSQIDDPMDISAGGIKLINGKLPPGVAESRRKRGLCGYCAGKHPQADCKLLKEKTRKQEGQEAAKN